MSQTSVNPVKNLIIEIITYLEKNLNNLAERTILDLIKGTDLDKENTNHFKPNSPPKGQSIQNALSFIKSEDLLPIKKYIYLSIPHLMWNTDNGDFYEKNSGIGLDYINGNMNTELIGPERGLFTNKQLRLGLFLLEPYILYDDHKHAAPELYLNLSDGTKWRFDHGYWVKRAPGTIIYNEPFKAHAMRVGEKPFFSVWCWPHSSNRKCVLTQRKKNKLAPSKNQNQIITLMD